MYFHSLTISLLLVLLTRNIAYLQHIVPVFGLEGLPDRNLMDFMTTHRNRVTFRTATLSILFRSGPAQKPWALISSSAPSGVTSDAPTSGRARCPMMSKSWNSLLKVSAQDMGMVNSIL